MNQIFSTFPIYLVIKIMIVILLGLYVLFALVMVRQEQIMSRVVEIPFSPLLRLITIIHLVAALAILTLAVLFL